VENERNSKQSKEIYIDEKNAECCEVHKELDELNDRIRNLQIDNTEDDLEIDTAQLADLKFKPKLFFD